MVCRVCRLVSPESRAFLQREAESGVTSACSTVTSSLQLRPDLTILAITAAYHGRRSPTIGTNPIEMPHSTIGYVTMNSAVAVALTSAPLHREENPQKSVYETSSSLLCLYPTIGKYLFPNVFTTNFTYFRSTVIHTVITQRQSSYIYITPKYIFSHHHIFQRKTGTFA